MSHTITALSAAEQSALFQFVSNGGNLAVFTENNNYDLVNGDASRASLLSPFGLATTGWIVNDTASIVASPTHPIALGPGGPLRISTCITPAGSRSWGRTRTTIAIETATDMPVMAAIERVRFLRPADAAVFLTDSSVFDDGFVYGPVLAANLVGYLVPEPGLLHKPPWQSSASQRSWAPVAAKPDACHAARKSAGAHPIRCASFCAAARAPPAPRLPAARQANKTEAFPPPGGQFPTGRGPAMVSTTVLKSDNVQKPLSSALDAGGGLLRLTPTWVPRSFLHPGKRIKLCPGRLVRLWAPPRRHRRALVRQHHRSRQRKPRAATRA